MQQQGRLVLNQWYDIDRLKNFLVPEGLSGWLYDADSMTERLELDKNINARFQLLSQEMGFPLIDEASYLNVSVKEFLRIRQVAWLDENDCWLMGRCVIPQETLNANGQCLLNWKNKPIGKALFADPSLKRTKVQFACLDDRHGLFHLLTKKDKKELWARRSLFFYYDEPLLVEELFYPPLIDYCLDQKL